MPLILWRPFPPAESWMVNCCLRISIARLEDIRARADLMEHLGMSSIPCENGKIQRLVVSFPESKGQPQLSLMERNLPLGFFQRRKGVRIQLVDTRTEPYDRKYLDRKTLNAIHGKHSSLQSLFEPHEFVLFRPERKAIFCIPMFSLNTREYGVRLLCRSMGEPSA